MKARLAMRLLLLADHHGRETARGVEIALPLSHETLARLTGSSRPRINQIMTEWKGSGVVGHHYGRVVLRDRATLEELARP